MGGQFRFDDIAIRSVIKLRAMFGDAEMFFRQINLLERRFSFIDRNQSAALDHLLRQAMDNRFVDFVRAKRLAGMFLVSSLSADFTLALFLALRLRIDDIT